MSGNTRPNSLTDSHPAAERILCLTGTCGKIINLISESMLILRNKRRTLEEKMIIQHCHVIAATLGQIVACLHGYLNSGAAKPDAVGLPVEIPAELPDLGGLELLNTALEAELKELLKASSYNFNYLEQYFEYDFCAKFTQESCFMERYQAQLSNLISFQASLS